MDIKSFIQKLNIKQNWKKFIKEEESGAIVVEATVSLFITIFTLLSFYSIMNVVRVQAQMTQLVHEATMNLSQLHYFYYYIGGGKDKYKHSKKFKDLSDGVGSVAEAFDLSKEYSTGLGGFDPAKAIQGGLQIWNTGAFSNVVEFAKQLVSNEAKSVVDNALVNGYLSAMAKSSIRYSGMDRDKYYSLYKVNNLQSRADLDSKYMHISYTYDVGIMDAFNINFKFNLGSSARTSSWYGR